MGKKRKTPGINGSSSADIAFMLLIFFLITTSMDTDQGLARRLPPPVPKDQKNDADVDIKNVTCSWCWLVVVTKSCAVANLQISSN